MQIEPLERRRHCSTAGLDASVGTRGILAAGLPADDPFAAEAQQPDGKTVLCGYTHDPSTPTGRWTPPSAPAASP